ncbi:MAG TPA: SGNH/GDSL hydrolase family protein [Rhizomicrobium sp.]|jgi:lysophospholipase L1-like esterase|nr:SGNH/GDSL hydrolase family protein [Rhizomicrobium sp.]
MAALMMLALAGERPADAAMAGSDSWITSWAATPAPRWGSEVPAAYGVPETLDGVTIRQVARLSVGGGKVRVVLSNEYGSLPMTIGAGSVAQAGANGALAGPAARLTWGGKGSVVVPPGAPVVSDPLDMTVAPLSSLAVSIYLPGKTALTSVHWDGAQTGYISGSGDFTSSASFQAASTLKQRLFLSGIQVDAKPASKAVVFFGDSITDGACSTADANGRWPDHIAERLQRGGHGEIAVVNEAFSGDRVLVNGMGVNALARLNQDVLSQPRLSTVVLMMGINDIGWPGDKAITPADKEPTADDIIVGYQQIIDRVHARGARIVGATLTPFADTNVGTPTEGYYTPEKEKIRRTVNQWIRTSGRFDGVIDFDKLMEDPASPGHMRAAYDCGDHLHPNDAGYSAMAAGVDLGLLLK